MIWRGLKGATIGAGIGGAVAAAVVALLFGSSLLVFDSNPADRAHDLERLQEFVPLAALAGCFVGAIGGLVARMPRKGVRLLTSVAVVAACAMLARLPAAIVPRYKGSPEPSYIPAILAALVGGALVLVYGAVVTKRSTAATDFQKADTEQPQGPPPADQLGRPRGSPTNYASTHEYVGPGLSKTQ